MTRQPTTHRVQPAAADAWIAGRAKPPAPGFAAIQRRRARAVWWALSVALVFGLALIGVAVCLVVAG